MGMIQVARVRQSTTGKKLSTKIVNIELIKPFNTATQTTPNSSSDDRCSKVKDVLKECMMDNGKHAFKWAGYNN